MRKFSVFFLSFSIAILASCGTLDKALVSNESLRKPLPPLSLDTGYDLYMMRVDLVRAYHNETRTVTQQNGTTSYTTTQVVSVPNAYHSIVVDFGNGVILDYNKNLCIDLVRLYNLTKAKGFKIGYKTEGFLSTKMDCVKENDSYQITSGGTFGSAKITGTISPNEVTINSSGFFGKKAKITIDGSNITLDDGGFFGGSSTIKKASPTSVVFPGFWNDSTFTMTDSNTIELDKGSFVIKHSGNKIEFIYSGFFGQTTTYTMIQTSNSTFFFNKNFQGCEIRRDGQNVIYFNNGKKLISYNVIKTL